LASHRGIGLDHRGLAVRTGPQILDRHRAGGGWLRRAALHLDQAHAAIAGDRKALVEAETRHLAARSLPGVGRRLLGGTVDLPAVYPDLAHATSLFPRISARSTI